MKHNSSITAAIVFGVYMVILGTTLMFSPNILLGLFQIPPAKEPWVHVVGFLAFALGTLYLYGAKYNVRVIFEWSVPIRFLLLGFFIVMILVGKFPFQTLLIGGWDALAALWMYIALKSEKKHAQ